jgi:hypothetical protein
MARPRKQVDVVEVLRLRLAGESFRDIASRTGLGRGTIHRVFHQALDLLKASQNRKACHSSERCSEQKQRGMVLGSEKVYPNG